MNRIIGIDRLRGLVMVLMTIDHSSIFFNSGRVTLDSAASYDLSMALPGDQFLIRFITHICAPTFIFLAGAVLAYSIHRKKMVGVSDWMIDYDIVKKGFLIIALDYFYISSLMGKTVFQVLYAIGASFVFMPIIRRHILFGISFFIFWFAFGETITSLFWQGNGNSSFIIALILGSYKSPSIIIIYPLLPWLATMGLGMSFGQVCLVREQKYKWFYENRVKVVLSAGLVFLILFVVTRYFNGYGNMFLYRYGDNLTQWLHTSKYPPSLSYISSQLSLMFLILYSFMQLEKISFFNQWSRDPLVLIGQVPLFYYIVHFPLLGIFAYLLGIPKGGIFLTLTMAFIALVFLLIFCHFYKKYRIKNFELKTRLITKFSR